MAEGTKNRPEILRFYFASPENAKRPLRALLSAVHPKPQGRANGELLKSNYYITKDRWVWIGLKAKVFSCRATHKNYSYQAKTDAANHFNPDRSSKINVLKCMVLTKIEAYKAK